MGCGVKKKKKRARRCPHRNDEARTACLPTARLHAPGKKQVPLTPKGDYFTLEFCSHPDYQPCMKKEFSCLQTCEVSKKITSNKAFRQSPRSADLLLWQHNQTKNEYPHQKWVESRKAWNKTNLQDATGQKGPEKLVCAKLETNMSTREWSQGEMARENIQSGETQHCVKASVVITYDLVYREYCYAIQIMQTRFMSMFSTWKWQAPVKEQGCSSRVRERVPKSVSPKAGGKYS